MEDEKKFIKGFNAGYLIAKHNPKLSKLLKEGIQNSENPIVQGFLSDNNEYSIEESETRIRNYFNAKERDNLDQGHER